MKLPIVQCACGGLIDARALGVRRAVRVHQLTRGHVTWIRTGAMESGGFVVPVNPIAPVPVEDAA